jgi:hypothetical protein
MKSSSVAFLCYQAVISIFSWPLSFCRIRFYPRKSVFKCVLLCVFLLLSCGENGSLSGTATDTENTVAGIVIKSDSSFAKGASVRMVFAYSVLPEETAYVETTTDSKGYFKFENVTTDTFNLEFRYALDSLVQESRILRSLSLGSRSLNLGTIRLEKATYVTGVVAYASDTSLNVGSHFRITVDSTTFETNTFVQEPFFVPVEAGVVSLIIAPADNYIIKKLYEKGYADSLIHQRISVTVNAGDTLDIGTYTWKLPPLEVPSEAEPALTGIVLDSMGQALSGVAVHIVTDLYGFGVSDSAKFITDTVTDSAGVWVLPAPDTALVDSAFRVEFRQQGTDSSVVTTGLSDYILKNELNVKSSDTVHVNSVTMRKPSDFIGKIFLVWNKQDSTKDTLCVSYTIKVGFKGTSNFTRVNACASIVMHDLPAYEQELVYYSGDDFVVTNLRNDLLDRTAYIKSVFVSLPEDGTLKNQGLTYTPPLIEEE